MPKLAVSMLAMWPVLSATPAENAEAASYWTLNGAVYAAPSVAPPYRCVRNYYVAPNGSDSNSGANSAPWRTISRAIAILSTGTPQGGVCVNVAPGTYTESLYLSKLNGRSDMAAGYLVFRSSTLHAATLQEPYANIASYSGNVVIQNSHYLVFDGFNVIGYPYIPNAGAHALFAVNSHHIKFLNNVIHDVGGAGIVTAYSDYIYAQGNIVYDTACCNPSGASAISLWKPVAVNRRPGFHNIISGNIVFNNSEGADGRSPHTEGHGIILDCFRCGPAGSYAHRTLIENNVVFGNGGAGISIWYSNNATLRNNTVFNNWRDPLQGTPAGDISVLNSSYITGINNIAVSNPSTNSRILSIWDQTWDRTNIRNVWANNITFNGTMGEPAVSRFAQYGLGTPITAANGNILGVDPKLVNPPMAMFTLQATSPAIGKGTSAYGVPALDLFGNVRSSKIDIGAFAFNIVPPN